MSIDKKQQLETQLWNIANTLRGKMDADDFRDYILGFIFYKYLSEKMHSYANDILSPHRRSRIMDLTRCLPTLLPTIVGTGPMLK